jgi:hypothetical protein
MFLMIRRISQVDGVQDLERLLSAKSKVAGCFGKVHQYCSIAINWFLSVDNVPASIEESLNSYLGDTG